MNSFQQTHGFEILRLRLLDQELRFAAEEFGFWEILRLQSTLALNIDGRTVLTGEGMYIVNP